ncbi:hypothetical protein J6590_025973 [Homalodisca vitripennis]|nr:hypothetical protein J6590_025973 [Homalodisca vitripennis]
MEVLLQGTFLQLEADIDSERTRVRVQSTERLRLAASGRWETLVPALRSVISQSVLASAALRSIPRHLALCS